MRGFGAKIFHIAKTEGWRSLVGRSQRYLRYRIRRASVDAGPSLAEWKALKGKYAGRRAFLLGNGPSLNLTELFLLRDEATMCFNRFDLMLERLNWLPTFYTTIDDRVLLDTIDIANRMGSLVTHAFFPDIHPFCIDFRPLIVKEPNVHWLFLDRASFSENLPYCGINKTVANVGIQILAYLGFSDIYLLGVDMTYSVPKTAKIENSRDITATEDDDESHFDPRYFGKGRKFHVPMLDETFVKFGEARRFYEERGVNIWNATVGGALEVFPRVSLSDVLSISEADKRDLFRELVASKLLAGAGDVLEEFDMAPEVGDQAEIDPCWNAFKAHSTNASKIVTKWISDYVPFGPLGDQHLWVSRRVLRPGMDHPSSDS